MKEAIWEEQISRRAVQALISQFSSVADAVLELVDNAIDQADGQVVEVDITFDKKAEKIIVESDGGAGMGAHEIAGWLVWGADNHENPDDIGFYGQGGKAAAGFLAKDVRIWSKKRCDTHIWRFEDTDWATRTAVRHFGAPEPVPSLSAPLSVRQAKRSRGHVRIELSRAYMTRRWNFGVLKRHVGSTYSKLLSSGSLVISVNGEKLSPLSLPMDDSVGLYNVDVEIGGIKINGWAGKLKRASIDDYQIKSGFRVYTKGRLIREGEWFGYNWQSKGALNLLIGELEVSGLTLNLDKSDFRERADEVWHEISTGVVSAIAPLIGLLRSSHEAKISKSEQKRAETVREELTAVLRELYGSSPSSRSRSNGKTQSEKPENEKEKKEKEKKEKTPESVLKKLVEGRGKFYEIEVGSWEPHIRASVQGDSILINKAFPAWSQFDGSKAYIAETALEAVVVADPDVVSIVDFVDKKNALLHRWAESQAA